MQLFFISKIRLRKQLKKKDRVFTTMRGTSINNIIIRKSKEDITSFLFNAYEDDNELIVATRQQQFYETKPRKIVAVGRGGGVLLAERSENKYLIISCLILDVKQFRVIAIELT